MKQKIMRRGQIIYGMVLMMFVLLSGTGTLAAKAASVVRQVSKYQALFYMLW